MKKIVALLILVFFLGSCYRRKVSFKDEVLLLEFNDSIPPPDIIYFPGGEDSLKRLFNEYGNMPRCLSETNEYIEIRIKMDSNRNMIDWNTNVSPDCKEGVFYINSFVKSVSTWAESDTIEFDRIIYRRPETLYFSIPLK